MPLTVGTVVRVTGPTHYLYSEVRSVVEHPSNQMLCWARPLVLTTPWGEQPRDVRRTLDLLWPLAWFTPAFDQETLHLWPYLDWEVTVPLGISPEQVAQLRDFSHRLYEQMYHSAPSE